MYILYIATHIYYHLAKVTKLELVVLGVSVWFSYAMIILLISLIGTCTFTAWFINLQGCGTEPRQME